MATCGHIRTIPQGPLSETIGPHYTIKYEENPQRKADIASIRTAIQNCHRVILATDADREGEAIAWHLCEVFGLNEKTIERIIFRSVTSEALQAALANPSIGIDMSIVEAQKARQCIDLMLGYSISQTLWDFVCRNVEKPLSAGRCQTLGLRILYDRQCALDHDQNKFEPFVLRSVGGYFGNLRIPFYATRSWATDSEKDKATFSSWWSRLAAASIPWGNTHYLKLTLGATKTYPVVEHAAPKSFSTLGLLQKATEKLSLSSAQVMKHCQSLYEAGFISYPRTDSSCEGIGEGGKFAHEAIRPTQMEVKELDLKQWSSAECKLYHLIWQQSEIAGQAAAVGGKLRKTQQTDFEIEARWGLSDSITFRSSIVVPLEEGIGGNPAADAEAVGHGSYLRSLIASETKTIACHGFFTTATVTQAPSSVLPMTESEFLHELEKNHIGRPSTFSLIVEKLLDREYIRAYDRPARSWKVPRWVLPNPGCSARNSEDEGETETITMKARKRELVLTPLGRMTISFLLQHFESLFQSRFTVDMDNRLVAIENQRESYVDLCSDYHQRIQTPIDALRNREGENKSEVPYFHWQLVDDKDHVVRVAKYGVCVYNCKTKEFVHPISSSSPLNMSRLERQEIRLSELLDQQDSRGKYLHDRNEKEEQRKACEISHDTKYHRLMGIWRDKDLILRKGKYGLYCTWGNMKQSLRSLGNRDIQNIRLEEVTCLLSEVGK